MSSKPDRQASQNEDGAEINSESDIQEGTKSNNTWMRDEIVELVQLYKENQHFFSSITIKEK